MNSSTYTARQLQEEAKAAALFSQIEAARLAHTYVHVPRFITWCLLIPAEGTPRLNVEYLVKGDEHKHATSVAL